LSSHKQFDGGKLALMTFGNPSTADSNVAAFFAAVTQGRNRFAFFTPELQVQSQARLQKGWFAPGAGQQPAVSGVSAHR
jgi:hypothetical protein